MGVYRCFSNCNSLILEPKIMDSTGYSSARKMTLYVVKINKK